MRNALALTVLLGGILASAHGDYYRFMYMPGATKADKENKEGQPGAMAGGRPGFPNPGMVGVRPGQPGFQQGGQAGFPQPGQPGFQQGGVPGAMVGGRPNPMGKPGENKTYDEDDELDLTQARFVMLEVKKTYGPSQKNWGKPMIEHKWGRTALHKADDIAFRRLAEKNRPIPTVLDKYEARKKAQAQGKDKKAAADPEKILDNADYCLTHGLYDKFAKEMDELVEVNAKHPIAAAYKKTKDALKRPISKSDAAQSWKDRLTGTFKLTTSSHYAALYNSRDTEPADVRVRLKRLEDNYHAFFYWFAFKGIVLTPPDHRLVVLFVDKPEDFFNIHQAFEGPVLNGDGFLARRENLAIFSMTPLDEAYDMLAKASNQMWTLEKWSKDDLLAGKFRGGQNPDDSAYAQEVALLLKAMADECEVQAVTSIGSQQLMGAVGLLPGNVAAPQWLQSGIASFFETPKSAYWGGTGAPHWKYFVNFRTWRDKRLEPFDEVFQKTITDQYFVDARKSNDPAAWEKAHTMAWALTYYLAQNQNTRDGFFRYLQELQKLPRDMDVDRMAYKICFARAFGIISAADESKIDEVEINRAMKKIAHDWYYEYMNTVQIDMEDVWKLAKKVEDQRVARAAEAEAERKKNASLPPGTVAPGMQQPPGPGPGPNKFVNPGGVRQPQRPRGMP